MIRKIINIDKEKCNGCGLCVKACHEGAIQLIDGKATLTREDYCDGLGMCLLTCPQDALHIEEREALEFNEVEATKNMNAKKVSLKSIKVPNIQKLNNWPIQIKLVSVNSKYLANCNLLIAADCTAYSYANFYNEFVKDRVLLIGCSKLDATNYEEKLTEIFTYNNIASITLLVMEVPCCNGLRMMVERAIANSKKNIPLELHVISIMGEVLC